jgi:DNA repair exonuclease SbcCD ATPase subunit
MENTIKTMFGDRALGPGPSLNRSQIEQATQSDKSLLEQRKNEIESLQAQIRTTIRELEEALPNTTAQTEKSGLEAEIARLSQQLAQTRPEQIAINRKLDSFRGQQEGGIAAEPTIVGENNQPEAVIPLARGSIPLNINFDPMLRILEQQREYLEEILSATEDNSDYLERIYHATA